MALIKTILNGCYLSALFVVSLPFVLMARFRFDKKRINIGLAVSNSWYDRLQIFRFPYDLAIARAGANIVTIAPKHFNNPDKLERLLGKIHGLVLSGGEDIHPKRYNGQSKENQWINLKRDELELLLIERAIQKKIPLLCVCRGAQLLAIWAGGELKDHGGDPEMIKNHVSTFTAIAKHTITFKESSKLFKVLGGRSVIRVNSLHHQTIKNAGRLKVTAVADRDVVEAVELPGDDFVVGVQWHPELQAVFSSRQQGLFNAFVEKARSS